MRASLSELRELAQRLRRNCIRMTTEAGSGHPTSCLSAAELIAAVFFHALRYDVHMLHHPTNDRFILSKGHAAPLLYAVWAEAGAIPAEKLMTLRRVESELEGHPTPRFPWAEVATGSLGQGLSIGVGMALAGKYLDQLDYRVYVLLGDGETAEGAVWEAVALAAYYRLNNLIALVDVNRLGQSQATMYGHDLASYERRFRAFGWHTIVVDGHDLEAIIHALDQARQSETQPVAILAQTVKGKGVSFLEDREGWHGKPLKRGEETERALRDLGIPEGWPLDKIEPPVGFELLSPPPLPDGRYTVEAVTSREPWPLPTYRIGDLVATREAYGTGLVRAGRMNPRIVALDGDTKNSTFSEKFQQAYPHRFFEKFIAEQNMVGAAIGLAARGYVPFASTFACFLTRAFDQIRMAGISRANIKLCGSHAGVSIGEDGPSQMGLEDLAMMRAVPGSVVLYPSDAVSTERAVELAATHPGIVYIRTTRPKTPVLYPNDEEFAIGRCKILRQDARDRLTIVAAGITLHEALRAYEELKGHGLFVRVVDLFSVKPLDRETLRRAARETGGTLLTVEDHYPEGGLGDAIASALSEEGVRVVKLAVNDLPRSGKPEELLDRYGISARRIVHRVRELVG
jgi:transketolase